MKRCATCLWWWEDLGGSGEKLCYNQSSPLYHRATKSGCAKHESNDLRGAKGAVEVSRRWDIPGERVKRRRA